jgi:flagellin
MEMKINNVSFQNRSAPVLRDIFKEMQERIRHLATGLRITQASEDAAGLAISERMEAQYRGLFQESRNLQDVLSRRQVAEGGMEGIQNAIQRMRELSVRAQNSTLTQQDREMIQAEIEQLREGITQAAQQTQFNTQRVIPELTAEKLGVENVNVVTNPEEAISAIENALEEVSRRRAEEGASINQEERRLEALLIARENLIAAETRIRGADMAEEMMGLVRERIRSQFGIAMMIHENMQRGNVLRLLGQL